MADGWWKRDAGGAKGKLEGVARANHEALAVDDFTRECLALIADTARPAGGARA